jgi:hypothetical protein
MPQGLARFHEVATVQLEAASAARAAAEAAFQEVAAYVNGATRSACVSDPAAFFAMLRGFAEALDAAGAENRAADEKVVAETRTPIMAAKLGTQRLVLRAIQDQVYSYWF